MSALPAVLGGFFLLSVMMLLLRWPLRALGLAAALIAWTAVGPWAFWLTLALVTAGTTTWKRYGPERTLMMRYPLVGVFAGSAGTALATKGSMSLVALCTALGALAGLGRSLP